MTCFTKINSKDTIDLNVKSKIINILANSIGENIDDLWYGFLDATPKAYGEGNDNPLQYSCLEKVQGQRSLAGYSPWCCKELDTA